MWLQQQQQHQQQVDCVYADKMRQSLFTTFQENLLLTVLGLANTKQSV